MDEIYAPLDPGIADVVMLLRSHGFNTFSSCEGGDGHDFDMPTIRLYSKDMPTDEARLAKLLSSEGYGGYYIKQIRSYQNDQTPRTEGEHQFIEIEFWAVVWTK